MHCSSLAFYLHNSGAYSNLSDSGRTGRFGRIKTTILGPPTSSRDILVASQWSQFRCLGRYVKTEHFKKRASLLV